MCTTMAVLTFTVVPLFCFQTGSLCARLTRGLLLPYLRVLELQACASYHCSDLLSDLCVVGSLIVIEPISLLRWA